MADRGAVADWKADGVGDFGKVRKVRKVSDLGFARGWLFLQDWPR